VSVFDYSFLKRDTLTVMSLELSQALAALTFPFRSVHVFLLKIPFLVALPDTSFQVQGTPYLFFLHCTDACAPIRQFAGLEPA
jgi:hypothetical protein